MINTIAYEVSGKGKPVVLLHGFCETRELWSYFKEHLSKNHQVIALDLPGFGGSPLPEDGFSITDIALLTKNFLEGLSVKNPIVIGHSMGGYVTLEIARQFPVFVRAFGLFHSSAFEDSEEKKNNRNKAIEFVKKNGASAFAESFVPSLFYNKNRKFFSGEINKAIKMAASTPQETLIAYTKAMRDRADNTNILKTFNGPILIIGGDKDGAVPPEKTKQMAGLPKYPHIHILPDIGHVGMIEKKEETLHIVDAFIKSS